MVFHWSLSNSKSPRVSRTFLSILADFNNAVIWMVSTCPLISKSSSPFTHLLGIVPYVPITIGIIVTFMFHSLLSSPAMSWYFCLFIDIITFSSRLFLLLFRIPIFLILCKKKSILNQDHLSRDVFSIDVFFLRSAVVIVCELGEWVRF